MKTTLSFIAAAVLMVVSQGSGSAAAQAYDPMRAAASASGPVAEDGAPAVEHAAPNPELGNLPDDEGAEETYYQCTACHSTAIILQQHLTDARWDYLWTWMVEDQGMYEPEEEEKELILSYLKAHFSAER